MHGRDWLRRLAGQSEEARAELEEAVRRVLPETLCWFGPDDDQGALALKRLGIVDATPAELRESDRCTWRPNITATAVTLCSTTWSGGDAKATKNSYLSFEC